MAVLPKVDRVLSPSWRWGSLGIVLVLLFPSASGEGGLGRVGEVGGKKGSFRVTLACGEILVGVPLKKARGGFLPFRTRAGKVLSLPVGRLRRMEPLPEIRVVIPGRKRVFPELEKKARQLARLLASPLGARRDRAEEGLVRLGRPIRPFLYKLWWTGPPEVSLRAARALKRIEALPWGPRGQSPLPIWNQVGE